MPRVRQEPELPKTLPPPNDTAVSGSQSPSEGNASRGASIIHADPNGGKKGTMSLPPSPSSRTEVAGNIAPSAIPDGIKPPATIAQPQKDTVKVFEDEQKAIRSPDSGFFDTKGFPLGEYANLIKERIKGKWFIPSNLRNSQGHTTVVFYIGKDGRFTDARIVSSSGSSSLDLAALKAVMDSNPFPPLPKGFPGDHVGAKFVLSYNE
jgi:TonB family protein